MGKTRKAATKKAMKPMKKIDPVKKAKKLAMKHRGPPAFPDANLLRMMRKRKLKVFKIKALFLDIYK